jgi:Protein of unknown function (DUF541)
MIYRIIPLLFLGGVALTAQVTQGSVTVTATRTATVTLDQITFGVNVTTPVTATRDEVVAALQGASIAAANFAGVYSSTIYPNTPDNTQQTVLVWTFGLIVPLPDLKSTVSQLSSVQKAVAEKNNGFSVSFGVGSASASNQAAQPCPLTDLISDARTQAQKLASASGLTIGSILAMAGPAYGTSCYVTVKFAAFPN